MGSTLVAFIVNTSNFDGPRIIKARLNFIFHFEKAANCVLLDWRAKTKLCYSSKNECVANAIRVRWENLYLPRRCLAGGLFEFEPQFELFKYFYSEASFHFEYPQYRSRSWCLSLGWLPKERVCSYTVISRFRGPKFHRFLSKRRHPQKVSFEILAD